MRKWRKLTPEQKEMLKSLGVVVLVVGATLVLGVPVDPDIVATIITIVGAVA